jgi:hypothetical protein
MDWLFQDRLPKVGVALLVGPSTAGKTFLAIDLARAVASGGEFFGCKPAARAGAVIFAGEDWQGVRQRLLALDDTAGPVWAATVENLRTTEEKRRIDRMLRDAYRGFRRQHDSDENSNTDCAAAVSYLSELAEEHQCLVVVTHHPGKRDEGARGGSALFANPHTVLQVRPAKRSSAATLDCVKNRNGPRGTWGSFALVPHVIKLDANGHETTTLRVETAQPRPGADAKPDVSAELACAIVSAVGERSLRKDPQSADSVHPLIAECATLDMGKPGTTHQTKAILEALLASGALAQRLEYIGGKDRPVVFAPSNQHEA